VSTKEVSAEQIMMAFAERTGLTDPHRPPRRYLWTDAFAVCNFLGFYRQNGDKRHLQYALDLVNQVHQILGRHRENDARTGWISGLSEEEGRRHPTRGGLRIGKGLAERRSDESFDEHLEWERDGQYFHYLTKWMHALSRVSQVTGDPQYNRWGIELAKTAHAAFTYASPVTGQRMMYWKMSIDLNRPLVSSMGQHDALDAFVTYRELDATARTLGDGEEGDLNRETAEALEMMQSSSLPTSDPLGIGGLLNDTCFLLQLIARQDDPLLTGWPPALGRAALTGLKQYLHSGALRYPPEYRLAFREFGVSIGLHSIELTQRLMTSTPGILDRAPEWQRLQSQLEDYLPIARVIEEYWLDGRHQQSETWNDHLDINEVMLATSLLPQGFLRLDWRRH